MALIIDDSVVETTTTTGTGALTLAGPVTGFKAFSSVMSSPSDTCYYLIEAIDGSGNRTGEWETGLGTYSGASTLTRTTVHKSSNSNNAVSLSAGTKRVMIVASAAFLKTRGALVYKSSSATGQNVVASAAAISWDSESFDTNSFHDTVTNNSRITIPSSLGGNRARLKAQITLANITADNWVALTIYKNGAVPTHVGAGKTVDECGSTTPSYVVETGIIDLTASDYYEVFIQVESDTSIDINNVGSWFQIEIIE